MIKRKVIRKWQTQQYQELRGFKELKLMLEIFSTYPFKECEPPFNVDFVSEAKCHESVFDAAMPGMEMKNTSSDTPIHDQNVKLITGTKVPINFKNKNNRN